MRILAITCLLLASSCDAGVPELTGPVADLALDGVSPETVTLELETRDGPSPEAFVSDSDLGFSLTSWDCGARGRWIQLEAGNRHLCPVSGDHAQTDLADCSWSREVEIGGSDSPYVLGATFLVREGDMVVGVATLVDRTELASDWYDQDPIQPYQVQLSVELLQHAR